MDRVLSGTHVCIVMATEATGLSNFSHARGNAYGRGINARNFVYSVPYHSITEPTTFVANVQNLDKIMREHLAQNAILQLELIWFPFFFLFQIYRLYVIFSRH